MFQCVKVVLWEHFSADVRHSPRRLWTVADFREPESLSSCYSISNCLSSCLSRAQRDWRIPIWDDWIVTARTRRYYAVSANAIGNSKLQVQFPLALEFQLEDVLAFNPQATRPCSRIIYRRFLNFARSTRPVRLSGRIFRSYDRCLGKYKLAVSRCDVFQRIQIFRAFI